MVYLERTRGISSTELRNRRYPQVILGVVGTGQIASQFISESKFVSGVTVERVFNPNIVSAECFAKKHELAFFTDKYEEFLEKISAVYNASPFETRYGYVERALQAGKHVLCEKPMVFNVREAKHLFKLAQDHGVILMEAIKTEYCPGFRRLISCAKSGKIGRIICVDAAFTKLALSRMRKIQNCKFCGSVIELAAYPLLAILQLLGYNYESIQFDSWYEHNKQVDLFTQIHLQYPEAVATAKVGLGVKSEDTLVISGTRGCIYVPAPWWKTEYFELCFEDPRQCRQ